MNEAPRKSGIDCLGDIAWGSHFCILYSTRQEQLELLVPFFARGLVAHECCVWTLSSALNAETASRALGSEVPDLDVHLASGQMSFTTAPDPASVEQRAPYEILRGWQEQVAAALAAGYSGMRISDNCAWLDPRDWRHSLAEQKSLFTGLVSLKIISAWTYSLEQSGPLAALDMVNSYHLALVKRNGRWEALTSYRFGDIDVFENPVDNVTGNITKMEFIHNVTRQKKTEESLSDSLKLFNTVLDTLPIGVCILDTKGKITMKNPAINEIWGGGGATGWC